MKYCIFAAILLLFLFNQNARAQEVTVLTWNIRYDNPADGQNNWNHRKAWLCESIREAGPLVFGIQEGLRHQVDYIDSTLEQYAYIGCGRDDGRTRGEHCAIFYRKKECRVIRQGTFWLSPTPGKVSVGWDAALERICTYGLFQTGETRFWVFNTHFDHMGDTARLESARLVLRKISSLNKKRYPVILMGDFNCEPGSAPYRVVSATMQDAVSANKAMDMGPGGTFNGFDPKRPVTERIDFIFTAGTGIKAVDYRVWRGERDGRFASDHFPVLVRLLFD